MQKYKKGKDFIIRYDISYLWYTKDGKYMGNASHSLSCNEIIDGIAFELIPEDDKIIEATFPINQLRKLVKELQEARSFWGLSTNDYNFAISIIAGSIFNMFIVDENENMPTSAGADTFEKVGLINLQLLPQTTLEVNLPRLKVSIWHEVGHIADMLNGRMPSYAPMCYPSWFDALLNLCVDGRLEKSGKPRNISKKLRFADFISKVQSENNKIDKRIIQEFADSNWGISPNMYSILNFAKKYGLSLSDICLGDSLRNFNRLIISSKK